MSNKEQFIQLYSFEKKDYLEIRTIMGVELSAIRKLYRETKKETSQIQSVRRKFTGKRQSDFDDFKEFYNWYMVQDQSCGYCKITQEELLYVFKVSKVIPLNDAPRRSSGTLEIERKDSKENSYGVHNVMLACPLCNNAKSNLIDEASWRELFVLPMRAYYENILGRDLLNPLSA